MLVEPLSHSTEIAGCSTIIPDCPLSAKSNWPSSQAPQLENMVAPSRHIEIKAATGQVVAVAIVRHLTQQIAQTKSSPAQIAEGNGHIALPRCGAVIDSRQQALAAVLPDEGEKVAPRRIVAPG